MNTSRKVNDQEAEQASDTALARANRKIEALEGELTDRYRELAMLVRKLEFPGKVGSETIEERSIILHGPQGSGRADVNLTANGKLSLNTAQVQFFDEFGEIIHQFILEMSRLTSRLDAEKTVSKIIQESLLFDPDWYLRANPDVKESGINPIEHYIAFGCKEGRNIVNMFGEQGHINE